MSKLAGKLHTDAGSPQQKLVKLYGRFETDGANAPLNRKGAGFTVTKEAGAGLYTIKLDRALADWLHIDATLWGATSGTDGVRVLSSNLDAGDIDTVAQFQLETHSVDGTEANLDGPIVSFEAVGHLQAT